MRVLDCSLLMPRRTCSRRGVRICGMPRVGCEMNASYQWQKSRLLWRCELSLTVPGGLQTATGCFLKWGLELGWPVCKIVNSFVILCPSCVVV